MQEPSRIRNIGIIAHIDAGKTTVSERFLYFSGRTHRLGEVHDGKATLDYLAEERERGITITAAATSFEWRECFLNLIDTPGHVDFTAEVERCLRVLDGGVGVFCAVAGVEPQSETVWRQAGRSSTPLLAFINKMDRTGADFERTTRSMRERCGATTLPIQLPVGDGESFQGIVDLVEGRFFTYSDNGMTVTESEMDKTLRERYLAAKTAMIEQLCEYCDELTGLYLAGEEIPPELVKAVIRGATVDGRVTPVLCGSALKNKGVRLLLDAVVDYLPSPLDSGVTTGHQPRSEKIVPLGCDRDLPPVAMAFKTITDQIGDLTFLRLYQGCIRQGDVLLNSDTGKPERVGRILKMHAGNRAMIDSLSAGDIGAVTGLKNTLTGHTLCTKAFAVQLAGVTFPEPVISVSVGVKRTADRTRLSETLIMLTREDPTLRFDTNAETDESILSGMGQLHLEVVTNRLRSEFNIDVVVGEPRVSYRQTLRRPLVLEYRHVKQSGGHGQFAVVKIKFELQRENPEIMFSQSIVGGAVPKQFFSAVRKGIQQEAARGGNLGYPFINLHAELVDGKAHEVDSSELAFKEAGARAFRQAARTTGSVLLEPMLRFEIITPEEFLGKVLGDITTRRGLVSRIEQGKAVKHITGCIPLSETFTCTTSLRSLSQGRATAVFEPAGYEPAPLHIAEEVIRDRLEHLRSRRS